MAVIKLQKDKIKRTLSNARKAWWVLLIIFGYSMLAWRFSGTSCLLASTAGLPCPGCGATRAFLMLLRGDIAGSLRYHPLLIPSVIFFCVYAFIYFTREQKPRYLENSLVVFAAILLGVYIARMAMMFPDTPPLSFNTRAALPRIIIQCIQYFSNFTV